MFFVLILNNGAGHPTFGNTALKKKKKRNHYIYYFSWLYELKSK